MPRLVADEQLERSPVVANCRMNRERRLVGSNGYAKELGFNPLDELKKRLEANPRVVWLDLCCGTGKALIEAVQTAHDEGFGSRITVIGVDLAGMFNPHDPSVTALRLIEASLSAWSPDSPCDLITCVHGLHYIGDKLRLITRAASWLATDGLFVANFDAAAIRTDGAPPTVRRIVADLRSAGLKYDTRRRLIRCEGEKSFDLPYTYVGADDHAGPNYTGQPAVASYYR
jgi:SAM-dependent methyltransferase